VKSKAVSKRAKDIASFVRICPSPVDSGSSIKGRGSIKRGEIHLLCRFFLGKSLRKGL
jgi:transposase